MFIHCKPSGTRFDLLAPTPEMVNIRDIARHLSNKCRWNGAVEQFYSVAQHCVFVSKIIEPAHALLGLMHEGDEPYGGDISTPMKAVLGPYARVVCDRFLNVVCDRFGLPPVDRWPASVKHCDDVALVTEWRDVVVPEDGEAPCWEMPSVDPWPEKLVGLPPKAAEYEFLQRFHQLYKGAA